ncbi:hypothetical protein LB506_007893, partial [Fusarium annulatum]
VPPPIVRGIPLPVLHKDLPLILHKDLPLVLQKGLPLILHKDLPLVLQKGLPLILHKDLPLVLHKGLPLVLHKGLPLVLHKDLPLVLHKGLPLVLRKDLPLILHNLIPLKDPLLVPVRHQFLAFSRAAHLMIMEPAPLRGLLLKDPPPVHRDPLLVLLEEALIPGESSRGSSSHLSQGPPARPSQGPSSRPQGSSSRLSRGAPDPNQQSISGFFKNLTTRDEQGEPSQQSSSRPLQGSPSRPPQGFESPGSPSRREESPYRPFSREESPSRPSRRQESPFRRLESPARPRHPDPPAEIPSHLDENPADLHPDVVNGWACVVTQNWNPRDHTLPQGLVPGLRVIQGDEVWVLRTNQGYGFVHRPHGAMYLRGWVTLNVLRKGVQRVDPLPIELPQVRNVGQGQAGTSQNASPPQDVLHATLRDLWQSIKRDENTLNEALSGMSEISKNIFFHDKASEYGDIVNRCITQEAREIMGNGRFTIDDFKKLKPVSPQWPKEVGVYVIIYGDFGGRKRQDTLHDTAFYVGHTIDFNARKSNHQQSTKNGKKTVHYRLASKAKKMVMVPIVIQTISDVPANFLDIAEFSMVCLLKSWYTVLFSPTGPSVVGSYNGDFTACLTFSRLMRQIGSRTGWGPDRSYGLNWETPIFKHPKVQESWTSWYNPTKQLYVYRTRRVIQVAKDNIAIKWIRNWRVQIPNKVGGDAGFRHGQAVHLVVEVAKDKNGEYLTHPLRFVRFPPMIGRNSELEKLRSLAVKIQWLPEGGTEWMQYYLERAQLWELISKTNPALFVYRLGMGILCDVEKITYTNSPGWLFPTAPSRVSFLRYDHLRQKRVLELVQPQYLQWPDNHTMDHNKDRLLELFPRQQYPNTIIGEQPAPGFFTHNRRSCDICTSQRTTTKCDYSPNDQSCQCCRLLQRVCTWSRSPPGDKKSITESFVHGQPLEELGIAVNISRNEGSLIRVMEEPPFNPDIENEEHADLTGDQ